ncbi:hypothetical protein [Kitasatospora purpeofusca]|uniref:hypothetical protein n=1 Tax=Kitasatospora purpeofusca TaxID=67352 RepID=UPI003863ACFA|nr:hypothetical protein OIP63_00620 [Kitasatospora purpeofusca]
MESDHLLSLALKDAAIAYGSLERPDFAFVTSAYQRQPYRSLVEALSSFAVVEDDTHLDDDVCFQYKISTKSGSWRLLLSMVGPYAMLFRAPKAHRWTSRVILEPIVDDFSKEEKLISGLADEWGFTFLSGGQSKISVEFPSWPGGPMEEGPLYRVLFSDVFDLAW